MLDDAAIPAALPSAASLRQCSRCNPGIFRRVNRGTLLERTVLTWWGFFPWECVSCRRKRYFRDQGRGNRRVADA